MPSESKSGPSKPRAEMVLRGGALGRGHHTVPHHPALMTADDQFPETPSITRDQSFMPAGGWIQRCDSGYALGDAPHRGVYDSCGVPEQQYKTGRGCFGQ